MVTYIQHNLAIALNLNFDLFVTFHFKTKAEHLLCANVSPCIVCLWGAEVLDVSLWMPARIGQFTSGAFATQTAVCFSN